MPSDKLRLLRVSEEMLADHFFLESEDHCYFVHEYQAGVGYQYSTTNDVISNLKKEMDRRGRPEWKWKLWAIEQVRRQLAAAVPQDALNEWTWVPMPPSGAKGTPEYDPRVLTIAQGIGARDVRELLLTQKSIAANHKRGADKPRAKPPELVAITYVNEGQVEPPPRRIILLDDMLTAGAHFVAARQVLQERFGPIDVRGVFYARCLH